MALSITSKPLAKAFFDPGERYLLLFLFLWFSKEKSGKAPGLKALSKAKARCFQA